MKYLIYFRKRKLNPIQKREKLLTKKLRKQLEKLLKKFKNSQNNLKIVILKNKTIKEINLIQIEQEEKIAHLNILLKCFADYLDLQLNTKLIMIRLIGLNILHKNLFLKKLKKSLKI